jgi:glycosyltransferase involved in cell wall biosynthesis
MRIAQLMFARKFGGAERSFVDLCIELAGRHHQVLAVCQPRSAAARALAGVPGVATALVRTRGWWDPIAAFQLARTLRRFAPQVVHAHLARASHLGGKAARRLPAPLVVKTHDYVDLKYYANVDFFVATTARQRRHLEQEGVDPRGIAVIPNFSRFEAVPARRPDPGRVPRLLGFGRLVPKKGYDLLLQALAGLHRRGCRATLLLAGEGPERAALERLSRALGVAAHVEFAGWCEDVGALLGDADLFVLPSRREPFGIAVLEAMAAGVPIVATRTDGPSEVLDEATAFLAAPDSVASLEQTLHRALIEVDERMQRAQRAARRYLEHYCAAQVVPQYLALYERLHADAAGPHVLRAADHGASARARRPG